MAPLVEGYTSVNEAISRVKSSMKVRPRVEAARSLESLGRILAEDVLAERDIPAFPTSHMDGYAVLARGLREAAPSHPITLGVVGADGPGRRSRRRVGRGEAVRVATGAGLPAGADAVLPAESVKVDGDTVSVGFAPDQGSHVYGTGEDFRRGELILPKGRTLRPQDVGLLLSLGRMKVKVFKKPKVSIMPTGSELTPAEHPQPGKVIESHSPLFGRLCELLGCEAVNTGVVGDEAGDLTRALKGALATSDLVVTLGGTSAGKRDLVVGVVSGMRPDVLVHGLKMDRGRVTGLASVRGKPVLMMPGPIQAAMNAFLVLGVPLISALTGREEAGIEIPCALEGEWTARRRFHDFQKVVYVKLTMGEEPKAEPLSEETESMRILTESDGYFVVPEDVVRLERGSRVRVRILPGHPVY